MTAQVFDINDRLAVKQIEELAEEIAVRSCKINPEMPLRQRVRRAATDVLIEFLRREQRRER